ncbi:MAG: hypothetical protein ABI036_18535, partial [Fibrobacteria bacterium]
MAFALAALGTGCLNDPDRNDAYFRLEASPDLINYSRVTVRLSDSVGNALGTLYDDSLPSVDRLFHLPGGAYHGGTVYITILAYQGTRLAYEETRLYDGMTESVISSHINLIAAPVALDSARPVVPPPASGTPVTPPPNGSAPILAAFPADTAVSIGDSIRLPAEAYDADVDLAGYAWVCDSVGRPKDSASLAGGRVKIPYGRSFAEAGMHRCVLKIWDRQGKSATAKVNINVLSDPPVANAGQDTIVGVETAIRLHAMGSDGFGPVVYREWKIGSGEFARVSLQETSIIAPKQPGDLVCILRITDSDGLTTLDTMVVKVVYNSDNTLAGLRTSPGKLDPDFRKDIHAYSLALGAADSLLTIIPTPAESHAKVSLDGVPGNAPV